MRVEFAPVIAFVCSRGPGGPAEHLPLPSCYLHLRMMWRICQRYRWTTGAAANGVETERDVLTMNHLKGSLYNQSCNQHNCGAEQPNNQRRKRTSGGLVSDVERRTKSWRFPGKREQCHWKIRTGQWM